MEYINKILHGDCLEIMPFIQGKSIDMILCDLPYNTTRNSWDIELPLDALWKEYLRIIKDNGAIILFGQGKFSAKLILSNEKYYRYSFVWDKGDRGSGFLNASRMPLRNHEDILVFYKKQPTYNPQFTTGEPLHGMGKKFKKGESNNNNYGKFSSENNPSANRVGDTKKYPKSILRFDKPHPPIHPTQKPVELCEYLIKTYTNEGDLVLDNCLGSASTCIAALNTNRNFIGIDISMEYCLIGQERLRQYMGKFEIIDFTKESRNDTKNN